MDKLKGAAKSVSKGGWHPAGDPSISRETWKSDLKGMATGKKKDPYEAGRNHQSAPLSSLKDPDSFGAPPRSQTRTDSNLAVTPSASSASSSAYQAPAAPARPPRGGLGSAVPVSTRQEREEQQRLEEEEKAKAPPVPYRTDTTGLRTDTFAPPPVHRDRGAPPAPPPRTSAASPPVPPRQPIQRQAAPSPALPPRMTENPDEYTPPPPPPYSEATQPTQQDPAAINAGSAARLGQAGVSVPGFGIGNGSSAAPPQSPAGHSGQLSELQQRFARMNAGSESQASPPATPSAASSTMAAAAHKKPPPPPPPKKAGLTGSRPATQDGENAPPPLPLSSKPRPN